MYGNREEQGQLLQQVLTASDTDADEERIPGEGPRPVSGIHMNLTDKMNVFLNNFRMKLFLFHMKTFEM